MLLSAGLASGIGSPTAQLLGDLAILTAALTALTAHTLAAVRRRGHATGRWFVVAGLALWTAGQLIWTVNGVTLNHDYPFPSVADIGFIGYALPAAIGLTLLLRGKGRRLSLKRTILDAGVVASSTFFIAWSAVLGPLAGIPNQDPFAQATQMAYPIADVFMVTVVIVLTMRAVRGRRLPWLCLGVGFWILAGTDLIYVRFTLEGVTGVTGSPLVFGWVTALLLIALSPLVPASDKVRKDGRAYAAMLELLPYLPVFSAVFFSRSRAIGFEPILVITGLVTISFVIVRQVLIVVENVTLTSELESKVAERTAELEGLGAIVNSSGDAIIGKDPDGTITSWNHGAERIYGYPASETIGKKSDFFIPAELLQEEAEALAITAAHGTVQNYESTRRRSDGTLVPVSITMSPVRGATGIGGVATISRDITGRRAAEAELLDAREAALEASRLKSEFLATMSHEIRTPLNAVIGLTSLLMDTELNEAQRQYAHGVKGAGEVLLTLINDILDFSKLEAGKVDLDVTAFDPRALVEEVAGLVAEAAQSKNLELISYCHPDVPQRLMGDSGRIRQILLNLASNAVKFTPSGEVEIQVALLEEHDGKASLRFQVRDTGIGISAADHQRLFESFAQADASTTRRYGGTGLGLAISRRLTEVMGGEIGLASEVGAGSRFWFVLELPVGPVPTDTAAIPASLAGRRVLVVDDNSTNRLVLENQLASWGMVPVAVPDASSALDEYHAAADAKAPYDLAVVDMCMPDTDGVQLARQLNSESNGTPAPGIILLTSTMGVDKAELSSAGIREYLTKPVRSSEFYNRLLRLVAGKTPRPAPASAAAVRPAAGSLGRLLVAEDNEVNQLVARGMANRLGYEVDIVDDGEQAVAATLTRDYAAVLMDCHMPVMDGFEATRTIRARDAAGRRVPIIAMTAGALDEDRERCFAAGMDDYISKPVDVDKLGQTLAKWVPQPTAAAGNGAEGTTPERPVASDAPDGGASSSPALANPDSANPALASKPQQPAAATPSDATSQASAAPAIDPDRVQLLRELGPGLLSDAVAAFREEAGRALGVLDEALSRNDAGLLRTAAHKLAGAAGSIGAAGASALSKRLEQLGGSGTVLLEPVGRPVYEELQAELVRAEDELGRTLLGAP